MSAAGPRHEDFAPDLAPYLLNALDDNEAARFERHLGECPRCRDELDQLAPAVAVLSSATEPVEPSGELRARLMATVAGEAELLRAAGREADRPPRRRRRLLPELSRPLAAGASALALAGAVAAGFAIDSATRGGGSALRTVAARVDASSAPHGAARLELRGASATLVVSGLPQPAGGRVYEVWLQRRGGSAPEPTDALFSVDRDGRAHVGVPGDIRSARAVMVTSEPRGGSLRPTTQPLIAATLS
jgi:anti-sigma factor RsiW